jgi:hypothetical protein
VRIMKLNISFKGTVQKFPGIGGWHYLVVPKKYTKELQGGGNPWGMNPIKAHINNTSWKTKLMIKKGGDYFIAIKLAIRKKENLSVGNKVSISFTME